MEWSFQTDPLPDRAINLLGSDRGKLTYIPKKMVLSALSGLKVVSTEHKRGMQREPSDNGFVQWRPTGEETIVITAIAEEMKWT